jgi:hypothetical protein
LTAFAELNEARPFPELPQLGSLADANDSMDTSPHPEELGFHLDTLGTSGGGRGSWRLGDRLVLGFARDGSIEEARRLVRLFFFHEYLHLHHLITGYTTNEVGKFPNVLEHADYNADVYSICHEFDRSVRAAPTNFADEKSKVDLLIRLIDEVIQTFRVFQVPRESQWQVRRLRRHLNWHWQRVRVANAATLSRAVRCLARKPTVELAGIVQRQEGRRAMVQLDRRDSTTELEMAVVLDNESVYRRPGQDLERLCDALIQDDVESVRRIFAGFFQHSSEHLHGR